MLFFHVVRSPIARLASLPPSGAPTKPDDGRADLSYVRAGAGRAGAMIGRGRRGAVFFDRDGVLNEDRGYVGRIEDFRWIEGAREAVRLVNQAGLYAIVATNQSGVARGLYSEEDVIRLHDWMNGELATVGAHIDEFYYCPYHREATIPRYRIDEHPDRKPNPGMILRGLRDFGIDTACALLIGDKETDLEAAKRAGIDAYLFEGGSLEAVVRMALER